MVCFKRRSTVSVGICSEKMKWLVMSLVITRTFGWETGRNYIRQPHPTSFYFKVSFPQITLYMMIPNKIPSYPSPKVDSNIFQGMTFFSPPGAQPRPTSSARNPTVPARPNPRCPLVSLAGEAGLMAGETPETCQVEPWGPQKTALKMKRKDHLWHASVFYHYWLLFSRRYCHLRLACSL